MEEGVGVGRGAWTTYTLPTLDNTVQHCSADKTELLLSPTQGFNFK